MILNFLFRNSSLENQIDTLKQEGIMLGAVLRDGRTVHYYMLRDLFVEVTYKDKEESMPERLNILKGIERLNKYLEKVFKSTF